MKRILLAALIAASALFTGCKASEANAAIETSTDTEAGAATETNAAAESDTLAENPANPAGTELTVAAFFPDSYLDYVAQEYMKRHENVTVTVNYYASDTERDEGKYRQPLNTAMMSGGGEDIVDASRLNWARLADRDMLADLNEGLTLDGENYYMNVLDGYLYKDKRIALPLNFTFEGYKLSENSPAAGETAAELTLEGLLALAEKYPGTALFSGGGSGMSAENLTAQLFYRDMDTFMSTADKTVNMNDGRFEEILNKVKAIVDAVNPPEDNKSRLDIYADGQPYLMSQYMIYSPAMCSDGLVDYSGVFPLVYNGRATYGTVGYIPAVNANTENRELAFDFLQFMISDEMMLSPEQMFCTVNKNVVEEKARLIYESTVAEGYAPEGFTEESFQKNIIQFNKMAEMLNVPEYYDSKVIDFLYEDLGEFFQGNIRAKETCDSLQSKLSMYMNE